MGKRKFTEFEEILMDIVKEAQENPDTEYDYTSMKIDADSLRSVARKELEEDFILVPKNKDIGLHDLHSFAKGYEAGTDVMFNIVYPTIDKCLKELKSLLVACPCNRRENKL